MKAALVTGSSRGIGFAIARRFLAGGYTVYLNGRDENRLQTAYAALKAEYESVYAVPGDVSHPAHVDRMFAEMDKIMLPHVLVNNAGVAYYGLFQQMESADVKYVIDNNLVSVLNCCYRAVQYMTAQQDGAILNVSSIWGVAGASCEAVYSAAKGGVNAFTKALAKELAPAGVRVNALALGVVDTEMNAHLTGDEIKALKDAIPTGAFITKEEAAETAFFLCSGKTTGLTGQIITIDGAML